MKKLLHLLMILPVLLLISSKNITINSKDYLRSNLVEQTAKSSIASSLNSFKSTLEDIPLYDTNKFNCTTSGTNVTCSTSSYQKVGLFSYPEYTLIGGNDSYLYLNNSYYVLNNSSVKNLSPNGLNDEEPSKLRAVIYIDIPTVKGSGTANDPYVISNAITFVNGEEQTSVEYEVGAVLGELPIPTKLGYTFVGWYLGENSTVKATPNTKISDIPDRKLYARWTPNHYTISYNLQNGTLDNPETYEIYDLAFNVGTPYKTVTIKGNANGTGATVGANTTVTQYFGGWDISGMDNTPHLLGDWEMSSTSVGSEQASTFKNLRATEGEVTFKARWSSATVTLPTVTKAGYTCGWAKTSSATSVQTITISESQSTTMNVYAVCNSNIYTITLNNQSATSAGTTAIYEKYGTNYSLTSGGSAATSITKPTKTNYQFGGYYTGTNGTGTQIINASGTIVGSNTAFNSATTLYAYWAPNIVKKSKTCLATVGWTAKTTTYSSSSCPSTYQSSSTACTSTSHVGNYVMTSCTPKTGSSSSPYTCYSFSSSSTSTTSCSSSSAPSCYSSSHVGNSYTTCQSDGTTFGFVNSGTYTSSVDLEGCSNPHPTYGCGCTTATIGNRVYNCWPSGSSYTCNDSICSTVPKYTKTTYTCSSSTCYETSYTSTIYYNQCASTYAFGAETTEYVDSCTPSTITCNASNVNKVNVTCN